jgi:hypothetical protein
MVRRKILTGSPWSGEGYPAILEILEILENLKGRQAKVRGARVCSAQPHSVAQSMCAWAGEPPFEPLPNPELAGMSLCQGDVVPMRDRWLGA